MAGEFEFTTTEAHAHAEAARQAINARLREGLGLERTQFWRAVAMYYARNMPEMTPAAVADTIPTSSSVRHMTAFG